MMQRWLKFALVIRINESAVCVNLVDPRSYDRELRHKKTKKNDNLLLENLLIHL